MRVLGRFDGRLRSNHDEDGEAEQHEFGVAARRDTQCCDAGHDGRQSTPGTCVGVGDDGDGDGVGDGRDECERGAVFDELDELDAECDGSGDGVIVTHNGSNWFCKLRTICSAPASLLAVMPSFTCDRADGVRSSSWIPVVLYTLKNLMGPNSVF